MFEDILKTVKEHFADNPQIAAAIPADQHDAVHKEVAEQIANNLPSASTVSNTGALPVPGAASGLGGGMGGILGKLKDEVSSGSPIVTAIEGGLIGSLASKFGLGSAATGAIAASLPGLLQRLARRKQ